MYPMMFNFQDANILRSVKEESLLRSNWAPPVIDTSPARSVPPRAIYAYEARVSIAEGPPGAGRVAIPFGDEPAIRISDPESRCPRTGSRGPTKQFDLVEHCRNVR